jgi:hypothetical protein
VIIGKTKDKTSPILTSFSQKHHLPAIFSFEIKQVAAIVYTATDGERQVMNVDLLVGGIATLVFAMIVVALVVRRVRSARRRKVLEQLLERYHSGRALVRYVQLNRQCSEEEAYQRLARFVKHHVPFDDHGSIDRMVVHDRQRLVERARSLLVDDPDEIDKI